MHKLNALREKLKNTGLDGMIIPMSDPFQNDFIPEYYHRIKYLSDFTGSLGTIIVLKDSAAIFIDGRYTLQAQKEVCPKLFEINSYGIDSMIDWLLKKNKNKIVLGYDPWDYTVTQIESLKKKEDSIIFSPLKKKPHRRTMESPAPYFKNKNISIPRKVCRTFLARKNKTCRKRNEEETA